MYRGVDKVIMFGLPRFRLTGIGNWSSRLMRLKRSAFFAPKVRSHCFCFLGFSPRIITLYFSLIFLFLDLCFYYTVVLALMFSTLLRFYPLYSSKTDQVADCTNLMLKTQKGSYVSTL
ncbi:hypothetical protein Ancab_029113 [Ancistrocladus abbreviatus]